MSTFNKFSLILCSPFKRPPSSSSSRRPTHSPTPTHKAVVLCQHLRYAMYKYPAVAPGYSRRWVYKATCHACWSLRLPFSLATMRVPYILCSSCCFGRNPPTKTLTLCRAPVDDGFKASSVAHTTWELQCLDWRRRVQIILPS